MIESSASIVRIVSVHHVGNGNLQQELKLSEGPLEVEDDKLHQLLQTYFLSNFSTPEYQCFTSEEGATNVIFTIAREIFQDLESFHENSVLIAKHLYESTQHPNIKPGDLFVAYFQDISVQGQRTEAIGIFKSENKDSFLKLKAYANQFDLVADEGINVRKLDKGCLILNQYPDDGYKILIVDNANRSDAQFWKQDFLNIKPWSDAYHHTQNYMNLTRNYVAEQIKEEFSVSRADQIDLMNKSVEYFKTKENFNQAEVLGDAGVIEYFRNYGKTFLERAELEPMENFEISAHAVKQQAKVFKTVLKLDKNFHIYIHGNRQLIEKGYDEATGKHFYKIYFDNES
jgi:hypothetical protein